jgi:hypothetical protein
MTFFAGNSKLILLKKQVDKDTPITDFTDAIALRVYDWSADPVRAISPLDESDSSVQEGASHVTAITPAISFGCYGRPSELDLLSEAILGDNDDSATVSPTTHIATPTQIPVYFSILVVDPFENTRYEGSVLTAMTVTAQDEGQTELRLTGLNWMVLGVTHGIATPSPMPDPVDELPFIYAEGLVKYDGTSLGRTSQFTLNINRNSQRIQGDAGFTALDIVHGKLQVDGSVTRYVADAATMKAVDTGSTTGTTPTTDIFTEALSILFSRDTGNRQYMAASQEIAYETREQALNLDGSPVAEVLGFRTQPETDIADNITLVTVNGKPTTEG